MKPKANQMKLIQPTPRQALNYISKYPKVMYVLFIEWADDKKPNTKQQMSAKVFGCYFNTKKEEESREPSLFCFELKRHR